MPFTLRHRCVYQLPEVSAAYSLAGSPAERRRLSRNRQCHELQARIRQYHRKHEGCIFFGYRDVGFYGGTEDVTDAIQVFVHLMQAS